MDNLIEAIESVRDRGYVEFCDHINLIDLRLKELKEHKGSDVYEGLLSNFLEEIENLLDNFRNYQAFDYLLPDAFDPRYINKITIERDIEASSELHESTLMGRVKPKSSRLNHVSHLRGIKVEYRDLEDE